MYDKIIAFDTETTGLNKYKGARPFCVSFTDQDMNTIFFRWDYDVMTRGVSITSSVLKQLQDIFNAEDTIYIAHNAKFDIGMLEAIGVKFSPTLKIYDTVVLAHVENNARPTYKLKPLCKKLLNFSDEDEKDLKASVITKRKIGKKFGWLLADEVEGDYALADVALCEIYAKKDTERCMLLYKYLIERVGVEQMPIFEMEIKLMKVLYSMESNGICIDIERANELQAYYQDVINKNIQLKKDLNYNSLNTRSPKQMKKVFYDVLDADPVYVSSKDKNKVRTKKLTVNKTALNKWAETIPLAKAIVNINIAEHELGSFVKPLRELAILSSDSRIHPSYRQTGAVTGRLSCSEPNLQNISNTKEGVKGGVKLRARELFVPAKDHVLYFPDYSQIEVWISAFCSKDVLMCESLTSGMDMHNKFNVEFYGHNEDFERNKDMYRKKIKSATFCTIYGGGADALAGAIGCGRNEAYQFLDMFRATYKELHQYGQDLAYVAREHGYIENSFGRRYDVNEDTAYKALNFIIQGSAADVMKRALINLHDLFSYTTGAKLLLTIHDEVCIEVHKNYHSNDLMLKVINAMQGDLHTYFGMPKPFEVSMSLTDTRWSEKKEIKL